MSGDFVDAAENAIESAPFEYSFVYTENRVSTALQVNQEGYLSHSRKIAYVNGYRTDVGSAVFAVGSGCSIWSRRKHHPSLWDRMKTPAQCAKRNVTLHAVAALSETEAFAVGTNGTILRLRVSNADGGEWLPANLSSAACDAITTDTTLLAIDFGPLGEGYIVGTGSIVLHRVGGDDAAVWHLLLPPTMYLLVPEPPSLRSVWTAADGTMVAVGESVALKWQHREWTVYDVSAIQKDDFEAVCGARQMSNADGAWLLGIGGASANLLYGNLYASAGSAGAALLLGNANQSTRACWKSAGTYGHVLVAGRTINSTDGQSAATVTAVDSNGRTGVLVRVPGDAPARSTGGVYRQTFFDIDCVSSEDCVAVGANGLVAWGPATLAIEATEAAEEWAMTFIDCNVSNFHLFGVAAVPAGSLRLQPEQKVAQIGHVRTSTLRPDNATFNVSNSSAAPDVAFHALFDFDLKLRRANDQLAGGDIWEVDFSNVTLEGEYQLYVRGLGLSHAFRIGDDALNAAAWHSCRGLFYQRSGTDLKSPPYADARWSHGLDHE